MLVRDVMKGEVLSISPLITLADARQVFAQRDVKYLVVMQGSDVQGVLSLSDLEGIGEDIQQHIKVSERMTYTPACVADSSNLENAVRLIQDAGLKALPVCRGNTLVGIVTLSDIEEFFSRHPITPPKTS